MSAVPPSPTPETTDGAELPPVTVTDIMSFADILRFAEQGSGVRTMPSTGTRAIESELTHYLLAMVIGELQEANVSLNRIAKMLEWKT
jgi:hypothetical protein